MLVQQLCCSDIKRATNGRELSIKNLLVSLERPTSGRLPKMQQLFFSVHNFDMFKITLSVTCWSSSFSYKVTLASITTRSLCYFSFYIQVEGILLKPSKASSKSIYARTARIFICYKVNLVLRTNNEISHFIVAMQNNQHSL